MPHRHPLREIARQAGVSLATVDRALNHRGRVSSSTMNDIQQAMVDLDRQRTQLRLNGRTFMVDVVMQAPDRFTSAIRTALEQELPSLRPAVIRARFHFWEQCALEELTATLDEIARRGSQGVVLKAPDASEINSAVQGLHDQGIPVVTLVTDLPLSQRLAYVGIDNRAAGATAAYLIDQWLGDRDVNVLIALSRGVFWNEGEREIGFRTMLRRQTTGRTIVEITDGDGLDASTRELTLRALNADPKLGAVYSPGGGNRAILEAFEMTNRRCFAFIAHDLDRDNRELLQASRISAVLHHDLRADMHRACQIIMRAHGALDGPIVSAPSPVHIISPHNVPPADQNAS